MTAAGGHLAGLELLLGDCCPVPRETGGRLIEISVDSATLAKLVAHWRGLSEGTRPRLRGMAAPSGAREAGRQLQLVFDVGGLSPPVLISAPLPPGGELPAVSAAWPYAAWWEEEIRFFEEGVGRASGGAELEVAWQRS